VNDLQPFMCSFSGCSTELKTFASQQDWLDHEFSAHRIDLQWDCPACFAVFEQRTAFQEHLEITHARLFTPLQMDDIVRTTSHAVPQKMAGQRCPFCQAFVADGKQDFGAHVGRHLQDVAFMALPLSAFPGMNDDEADSYNSDARSNMESSYALYPDITAEYPIRSNGLPSFSAVCDMIKNGQESTCIAITTRFQRCRNALASAARIQAASLVKELLASEPEIKITLSHLEVLARLLLCRNHRQFQSATIASRWLKEVQDWPLDSKNRSESQRDLPDNISSLSENLAGVILEDPPKRDD
jgi:hypothetical protein